MLNGFINKYFCKYMYIELCLFFNENYLTLGQNLDTITLIEFSNIM